MRALLVATTMALAMAGSGFAQDRLPPGSLRAQIANIVDRQGFERPMTAGTMLVPAGWQVQAEVAWARGLACGRPYHSRLMALAPDGRGAIELAPGEAWGAGTLGPPLPNCPMATIASAEAYLRAWVQRHRPGAQWLGYKPNPQRTQAPVEQALPMGPMRQEVQAGQALIRWEREGRMQHEWLGTVVAITTSRMQTPGMPPAEMLVGEAGGVLAWRAAGEPVAERLFAGVWQSLQSDPEWKARVDAGMRQMQADNMATQQRISQIQAQTSAETLAQMQRRHEIRMQTQQDIAAMRDQGFGDRMASQDAQHRQRIDAIREVQRWRNPEGGTVALPQAWPHAWKLRDGSYVLTDTPNFDPARDLGVAGQRLEPAR